MAVVKRVGVLSVGKIAFCLYALLGLIAGGLISLISLAGAGLGAASGRGNLGIAELFLGVGAVILIPITYGLFGCIAGIIGAAIYNLVASFIGGIEIELE